MRMWFAALVVATACAGTAPAVCDWRPSPLEAAGGLRRAPIAAWTDIGSQPVRTQSVVFWFVDPGVGSIARSQLQRANAAFRSCGIAFRMERPAGRLAGPPTVSDLSHAGCDDAARLRAEVGFEPRSVNVYYLEARPAYRGAWCGAGASPFKNMILMYRAAGERTLAHELGHALSLDHPPFIDDNLMSDLDVGDHLTVGQCYRARFDARSILNGRRSGSTRCDQPNAACPPLELDVR